MKKTTSRKKNTPKVKVPVTNACALAPNPLKEAQDRCKYLEESNRLLTDRLQTTRANYENLLDRAQADIRECRDVIASLRKNEERSDTFLRVLQAVSGAEPGCGFPFSVVRR